MIHLTPEQINILKNTIDKWGIDSQIKMLREEFLETAIEIGKFYERDATHTRYLKVLSEIADATIMVYQMQLIPEMRYTIEKVINSKLERLNKRIKSSPTKVDRPKSIFITNKEHEITSLNNRNKNLIEVDKLKTTSINYKNHQIEPLKYALKLINESVNLKQSQCYVKGKHISKIIE